MPCTSQVAHTVNVTVAAVLEGKSQRHEVMEFTLLSGQDRECLVWAPSPVPPEMYPTKGPWCEECRAPGRSEEPCKASTPGEEVVAALPPLETSAGLAQQADGVMPPPAWCLFRWLAGFAVPMRGIKNIAPPGSQGQACLKPSSVETQNNSSSLKPERVLAFLNQ